MKPIDKLGIGDSEWDCCHDKGNCYWVEDGKAEEVYFAGHESREIARAKLIGCAPRMYELLRMARVFIDMVHPGDELAEDIRKVLELAGGKE